jgi:hypothetical protein
VCTWGWSPLHACGDVVDWGDIPTWVAGALAAVAAVFAYRAYRAYRIEMNRDV